MLRVFVAYWRFWLCVSVVYELFLIFILFQVSGFSRLGGLGMQVMLWPPVRERVREDFARRPLRSFGGTRGWTPLEVGRGCEGGPSGRIQVWKGSTCHVSAGSPP